MPLQILCSPISLTSNQCSGKRIIAQVFVSLGSQRCHLFLHAAILSSIISLTSSKRKNLLVLNVTVLGVLVQALFAFKWPVLPKNPFLQSSLQGKEKICSCCTLIFPLGVLAEGLLQRPFYPFEWLELPRRCKICISQAHTH